MHTPPPSSKSLKISSMPNYAHNCKTCNCRSKSRSSSTSHLRTTMARCQGSRVRLPHYRWRSPSSPNRSLKCLRRLFHWHRLSILIKKSLQGFDRHSLIARRSWIGTVHCLGKSEPSSPSSEISTRQTYCRGNVSSS